VQCCKSGKPFVTIKTLTLLDLFNGQIVDAVTKDDLTKTLEIAGTKAVRQTYKSNFGPADETKYPIWVVSDCGSRPVHRKQHG
jgi:hypothetical protein